MSYRKIYKVWAVLLAVLTLELVAVTGTYMYHRGIEKGKMEALSKPLCGRVK